MVNPLSAVYNLFRGFLSCLPTPFISFIYLVVALFVILAIVRIIKS